MTMDRGQFLVTLFAKYRPALESRFRRRLQRDAEVAEFVQEVFLRMLRAPPGIENPAAYLFTVAANLLKEVRASGESRLIVEDSGDAVDEVPAEIPDLDDHMDSETRKARLREVLLELSPKCQAAVVLHYWHGETYDEIAKSMQISVHGVKKLLSRSLEHCRRQLSRLE
jgi:RNA polymerase sigma-70 factor (ECF subfamily)